MVQDRLDRVEELVYTLRPVAPRGSGTLNKGDLTRRTVCGMISGGWLLGQMVDGESI
jgi:hypothetical protein